MSYRPPRAKDFQKTTSQKSREARRRSRRRARASKALLAVSICLVVIIAVVTSILLIHRNAERRAAESTTTVETTTEAPTTTTAPTTTEPTEPVLTTSMTFGSTGDILIHPMVLDAFNTGDGHDFTGAFEYIAPYYEKLDLMVANLEVPLVDPADGYEYSANPFASPDAVAEALKGAGVDVCLTANNHTYDMGSYGMMRTQDVLDGLGLDHTGTRRSADESYILVEEVNDIRLGMICYTYDTGGGADYEKSLNYIPIYGEDADLVNTFNYYDLDALYADAEEQLRQMDKLGCDVSVFYMHWGEEYQDEPNGDQVAIAQQLCELGVDIIIGGHPHVVQKFDVLESESGHQTICLYSMGNELSNQRREYMNEDDYRGYTEDGVVFTVTIDKYSDGAVEISAVDILPTWVERDGSFWVLPLDAARDPSGWDMYDPAMGVESYNRTIGRLGEAYIAWRASHGQPEIPEEIEY